MELEGTSGKCLAQGLNSLESLAKDTLSRKILALMGSKDFQSDLTWIAKTLGESLSDVDKAVKMLASNKIIIWDSSGMRPSQQRLSLSEMISGRTRAEKVSDHSIISHQIINDLSADSVILGRNGFYATSEEVFERFRKKFKELEEQFITESLQSDKSVVVEYTFSLNNIVNDSVLEEQ